MDKTTLAARIMDVWATAGLIDGDDTSRQGNEDPEWRKAKLALDELDELGLLHIDGSDPAWVEEFKRSRAAFKPGPTDAHIDGQEVGQ